MVELVRMDVVWGSDLVIEAPPSSQRLRNVLYLPWRPAQRWGLFDRDGLALAAAWEHAPQGSPVPPAFTAFRLEQPLAIEPQAARNAPTTREPLIYGGRVHTHFGHFLLETWPHLWKARGRRRILVHGPGALDLCVQTPSWIGELLSGLGLERRDFVWFDAPTVCQNLEVPQPSLRHQAYAHREFGALCRRAGARLLGGAPMIRNDRPVYMSKSKLPAGVSRLVGEEEVEARLAAGGVEIVHPELMSIREKVMLFATRPAVLGTTSSAFHLGLFAPPVARQIRLCLAEMLNSGHRLSDRLGGHGAIDLHQPGTKAVEPGTFQSSWSLPDPAAAAHGLLAALNEG